MLEKLPHLKKQALLFAGFSFIIGIMNILQANYSYLWQFFSTTLIFIILFFTREKISAYIQTGLILLNGVVTVIFGDATTGMLFVIVSVYSWILYSNKYYQKKYRYSVLLAICLLADMAKVIINKQNYIMAISYGLLFFAIVIFIDNIISQIIEKEKQKVREELKKKDAVISNLRDLLKETIITSEELMDIARQLKGKKNGS